MAIGIPVILSMYFDGSQCNENQISWSRLGYPSSIRFGISYVELVTLLGAGVPVVT